MRQLDFVRTPKGGIAIIKERTEAKNGLGPQFTIEMLRGFENNEKTAWWSENELTVIDSIPNLLSRVMAHPFSNHSQESVDIQFPL